jgi:Domain of unknown function (DUF5122) beta-propeller
MPVRCTALLLGAVVAAVLPAVATATPLPSPTAWVTNGTVTTIVPDSSGRLYLGGAFTHTGPRIGHGLRITTESDLPTPGFPDINGPVLASVSDGAGGYFIGGSFTSIGGVGRNRLAHIRADGSLDPSWNPGASAAVRTLALTGDALFVGGDFTGAGAIGGAARVRLAKLSAGTGAVDPTWNIAANQSVQTLLVSGSLLYVGGKFSSLDDHDTGGLGRLARVTMSGQGEIDETWYPAVLDGEVHALATSGSDLFVGGSFTMIGGDVRSGLAKTTTTAPATLDATWMPEPSLGMVQALALSGSDLFVGGQLGTIGGQNRQYLAKVATTGAGAADATWDPNLLGPVNVLAVAGSTLLAGGNFGTTGDLLAPTERLHLAAFSTSGTGAATAWNPNPNGPVNALALSGSTVFAGGDFTSAGPQNQYTGSTARLNPDGTVDTSWKAYVYGSTQSLVLDDSRVFVAGYFQKVNASLVTRPNLAKLATADGTVDPTWDPGANDEVTAMALSGGDLFVAGKFFGPASIGGQTRNHLAKVSTSGVGTVDPTWNPSSDGEPSAIAVAGDSVFVGGTFTFLGGVPRNGLAKVSATGAGLVDPTWQASPNGPVYAILPSGADLFVGGDFTNFTDGGRTRIAKLSATGALSDWRITPGPNAPVRALALDGDRLYAAGDFTQFGGLTMNRVARASASTGAVDSAFQIPVSTEPGPIRTITFRPDRILIGGAFRGLGTLSSGGFAVFDTAAPTVTLGTPGEGARYKQGAVVSAAFSCADDDGATGLTCIGTAESGSSIDTGTPGEKAFTVTATDAGGNSVSQSVKYVVDGSAPTITITSPGEGAAYVVGTKVDVAYACADEDGPADVVSCTGSVPSGAPLETSTPGTHTFTVTSRDTAGNASSKSSTYHVAARRPIISALKITPATFRAAPKGATTAAKKRKIRVGGKVTYRLSNASTVTFTVTQKKGRKAKTLGAFKLKGKQGNNKFTFRGRLKKKALKPGNYRLIARATGASGLKSVAVARTFKIVKG